MDIFQLKAFLEVSRCRNLTRAADKLHISPSALSSRIQSLEAHLGVILFTRSARGMLPTEDGQALIPLAERIIGSVREMESTAGRMRTATPLELKIGINASPDFLQISRISQEAATRFPHVKLHYISSNTLETSRMLQDDEIQLGFMFGETAAPGVTLHRIAPVDVHVVVPKQLAAHTEHADWGDIVQLPWIWVEKGAACHAKFQRELDRRGLPLNKVTYSLDDNITRQLVKDGQGLALMRDHEAKAMVRADHAAIWAPGSVSVFLALAHLSENAENPLINDMVKLITDLWPAFSPAV